MLKIFPVEPEHLFVGWVIAPGALGIAIGEILPVVTAALAPHTLLAVTETIPGPVPMVIVAETVVPPAVTAQPGPVTDQV